VSGPFTIQAEAWYDGIALERAGVASTSALDRARQAGELRSTRRSGRTLFLGAWVHSWLAAGNELPRKRRRPAPEPAEARPCA
jgi:hypothetical protein